MQKLIIVESPTKSKTITKFLGKGYIVESSFGHVRDLPKGKFGVDIEKNFKPEYVIPTKARKNLNKLKSLVKNTDLVILATDEDREGEAIAWHLISALELKKNKKEIERIVFHEITKEAIQKALENPRDINMDLVHAQQARRILDRLVGYKLSPFLWKKVLRGLSAGRVQSVAVRLVVEREREIDAFKPQEYHSIISLLQSQSSNNEKTFTAYLYAKSNKRISKLGIKSEKEAKEILAELKNAKYSVENIAQKDKKRNPLPPFRTSTLQQAAGARFGYQARRTMMLAQNLYERGFITYHRTDSLSIASSAMNSAREYIQKEYGDKYIPSTPNFYKTHARGAQEAHEAIRPAFPEGIKSIAERAPKKLKMEGPQLKLYTLIWQRFIASQMTSALYASSSVDISTVTAYTFKATGSTQKFDGFTRVYPTKFEENELPPLKKGESLLLLKLEDKQHFTQPPARYSEATLIKILEEYGIGRPSTYASIISTIQDRNYVTRNEQKRLEPTEIGITVTDLLLEHFPRIIDIQFTASMEKELDEVADGKKEWKEVLSNFYTPFEKNLEKKYEEVEKKNVTEETNKKCPKCGKDVLKRMGRFGWFYACSGFPECRHTEAIKNPATDLNVHCPKCVEGDVVEKRTKRGKNFYGCSRYPDCDFATWDKPYIENMEGTVGKKRVVKCPECNSALVEKPARQGKSGVAGGKDKIVCSSKECKYQKK